MSMQAAKKQDHANRTEVNDFAPRKSGIDPIHKFVDNRAVGNLQRKLQAMADNSPRAKQLSNLQTRIDFNSAPSSEIVVQREVVAGTLVVIEGKYPTFSMDGKKYHIDEMDPKHVTCDSDGRTHYYFEGSGEDIVGVVGEGKKKKGGKTTKYKFEQLPNSVQTFIKQNYLAIVTAKAKGTIDV